MTLIRQVRVKRIDWFRVLADLKRAGLSLRNIAALTGLSKTQLIGLRNEDTEPKHLAGEALVVLWGKATNLGRESLPMSGDEFASKRVAVHRLDGRVTCPLCGTEHRSVQESNMSRTKRAQVIQKPDPEVDSRQLALSLNG